MDGILSSYRYKWQTRNDQAGKAPWTEVSGETRVVGAISCRSINEEALFFPSPAVALLCLGGGLGSFRSEVDDRDVAGTRTKGRLGDKDGGTRRF